MTEFSFFVSCVFDRVACIDFSPVPPPHQHKLSEFIIDVGISLEQEGIYSP